MKADKIGEYIKNRRSTLRLQQKDLAELSGVSLRTIIQIENGTGNPSIDTLNKLTKVLGVEIEFKIISK
ncbi:MAG: helix-turn-helix domain-containing protein [Bacteroidia bacterium]|jgi:y4mF family transcriptional regulator|nr:helix-turn-helix domain-containing protein [Bacteroidia bacterium]